MNGLKRFVGTSATRPVDGDIDQRILRQVVFATTGLASDGWIILPEGMDLSRYEREPIVLSRHMRGDAGTIPGPMVIGRALKLMASNVELAAEVQFADTQEGREYAYLYGLNKDRTPYMRAWSVEGPVIERRSATWKDAQAISAQYWDAALAERLRDRLTSVQVALRFELAGVAAVPSGADRGALTRAASDGVQTAQALLARMDLEAAGAELAGLMSERLDAMEATVARLEMDIQALRGEGASAAARGDSEAVLAEVRELSRLLARQ